LRTETEKAERGGVQDRGRNAERRLHDQGRLRNSAAPP
jgi:hypothetical protein